MIFHSFVMFFVCLPEGIGLFHAAFFLPCADVSRWSGRIVSPQVDAVSPYIKNRSERTWEVLQHGKFLIAIWVMYGYMMII